MIHNNEKMTLKTLHSLQLDDRRKINDLFASNDALKKRVNAISDFFEGAKISMLSGLRAALAAGASWLLLCGAQDLAAACEYPDHTATAKILSVAFSAGYVICALIAFFLCVVTIIIWILTANALMNIDGDAINDDQMEVFE